MIIDIEDELYYKMLEIVKGRSKTLYNQVKDIKPLADIKIVDTLTTAREIKSNRIKENIKETLIELLQSDIKPNKYNIHKRTNIAYITLNKYYDEILEEVLNER